jgi:hypothetical protein
MKQEKINRLNNQFNKLSDSLTKRHEEFLTYNPHMRDSGIPVEWRNMWFAMMGLSHHDYFTARFQEFTSGVSVYEFKSYLNYCIDNHLFDIQCDDVYNLADIDCFIIEPSEDLDLRKIQHDMYIEMIKKTENISMNTLQIILFMSIVKCHTPVVKFLIENYPIIINTEYLFYELNNDVLSRLHLPFILNFIVDYYLAYPYHISILK